MKNTFRAFFGVSALALLLVAAPVLAAEVDVESENHKTGADSRNINRVTTGDNQGDVNVTNNGDVNNDLDVNATTGENEQNRNTGIKGAGDPDTGSVDVSGDWENVVNSGSALYNDGEGWEIEADFKNDTTGADSVNRNELTVENGGDVTLRNIADIVNDLEVTANTGDNVQRENTTVGDITTGDVDVDSDIMNEANSSDSDSHMNGSSSVKFEADNKLTGADSVNTNIVNVNGNGRNGTSVRNRATITNDFNVDANTGGNRQARNTTAGDIDTGDVDVKTDVTNRANNGGSSYVGGHSMNVEVDSKNDTTGADSVNRNIVNVNNSGSTTVENRAEVTNNLVVEANTGDNVQRENTMAGEIHSGDVEVNFTVDNQVN